MKLCYDLRAGVAVRHVKVKPRCAVLTMLKRLDKIRFRGPRTREDFPDLAESPPASDNECSDDMQLKPRTALRDTEEILRDPAGSGSPTMAAAIQDFQRSESDRLNEVKGHLEIALLEKHFLQEELRKLREETNVDSLRQELERERSKRIDLEQKMNEVLKTRLEDSPPQPPRKQQSPSNNGTADKQQKEVWSSRLQKWLYERFGVYIEDFRFQPEESTVEAEEPLSAKRLTENMRRLKRGARPVTNFLRNLSALSNWHSVYTSAIAFIIYMNAAWHGWAIPMLLFLAILRLSLNYLIARGWRIQWSIVPEVSEPMEPPKEDLTVSEKFQLVLDVAQKAQNLFGKMADVLEKIKNLFMWVQPESTRKLYICLWVTFITSCVLPYKLLGFMMGLYAGIKFFIIDFLFKSCPKLRDKYDTPYIVWNSLPTDPQLKERTNATVSRRLSGTEKVQPVVSRSSLATVPCGVSREEETGRSHSTKKGAFHEVFNLQESERPLAVCENGWRCCLINRDRKMPTDYIRNGVLYVTENYLCFESSSSRSSSSKKNKVIKLVDITDIQKYKVLSVLPGSGMGISIATPSTQKPLVFGAMIHRDEAFEAIFTQYMKIMTTTKPPASAEL
ncbi:GRAM domain-containing protein 4 isoform X1 [Epinephelus fuscoguttatus]|uniref:GRAM domain-containing protein 4 isoform X1 n=1 Tax=Epinephelus lanceolatus TaxID=310571 RepID=UPI0014460B5A|nr:GRAM domain-containing protein 4 isoform X1 [Epinephelus lanceolatus]XP_049423283.1 GRAM domain-containing protein 4 isoform X1 [Epinephelus fuscoguttatus]